MTQIQNNNPYNNIQTGTPLYNYSAQIPAPAQTVSVATPATGQQQVYTYPQSSVYTTPNNQAASGVNIYIYNPSAIGGPTSNSTANATYGLTQGQPQPQPQQQPQAQTPITNESPIAANKITNSNETNNGDIINVNGKKSTHVVELTDDYIKTLESYLKSPDSKVRQSGIKELIKRYEEDNRRYNDPALTALLNISLLDPDPSNRLMAMSVISSGSAQGDDITKELLKNAEKSDKLYGQEAIMANKALLKAVEQRTQV
jgi:hypothetical protein